ncbi:unnamed protein product, partial [Lymnaea stagnalis]
FQVDGQFGQWSDWIASTPCGQGIKRRTRKCDSPAPINGGKRCKGNKFQFKGIYNLSCPGNNFLYVI